MAKVRYTVVDGEVIAEKRAGVRRQYVPDPLGSTVTLLDNTQTKTDTFSYWPYGEEQSRTGTTPTPFRYVGTKGYYKDSHKVSYVRARYLRTDSGSWTSEDPIYFTGRDWNLYNYCAENPVRFTDRFGLCTQEEIKKFGEVIHSICDPIGGCTTADSDPDLIRKAVNWLLCAAARIARETQCFGLRPPFNKKQDDEGLEGHRLQIISALNASGKCLKIRDDRCRYRQKVGIPDPLYDRPIHPILFPPVPVPQLPPPKGVPGRPWFPSLPKFPTGPIFRPVPIPIRR